MTGTETRWLKDKQILLISPQDWDHIPISKHHYAEALGLANRVLFLDPPDWSMRPGAVRSAATERQGVERITWRPCLPRALRFHAPELYRLWIGREVRRLVRTLRASPDLVWCFDFNTYPDLRAFGAPRAIFHPVDPISDPRQARVGRTADLVLSVSERILASVTAHAPGPISAVISHGTGPEFEALARMEPSAEARVGTIQCGYFGNLDRPTINVDLLRAVARQHPDITFHFWGPFSAGSPLTAALADCGNCKFHGALPKAELAQAAAKMDCLLLSYQDHATESDRSNSHKFLEYFATGKVVVSTRMSIHADDPELIRMSGSADDSDFPDLFSETVSDLGTHNAPQRQKRRKALALQNTYPRNIARIDSILCQIETTTGSRKETRS